MQTQILTIVNQQNDVIEKNKIVNVNKEINVNNNNLMSILLKTLIVVVKVERN